MQTPLLVLLDPTLHKDDSTEFHDCQKENTTVEETSCHMLKLFFILGSISSKPITILIDFGAAYNLLNPHITEQLPLPMESINPVKFTTTSRDRYSSKRVTDMTLKLQDYTMHDSFLLLDVPGCDLILGAEWLESLGFIGLIPSTSLFPTYHTMDHLLDNPYSLLASIAPTDTTLTPPTNIHPTFISLIHQYKHIFANPLGLPPKRSIDHKIPLLPHTNPINVYLYRYPHYQKAEIEKQVREFLNSGVIRPSLSPFSSPILLVKKKDEIWHLCIDYQALNAATIKDCFPIPVVDEVLDDLIVTTIFLKLDLRSGYHQIQMSTEDIANTTFCTHDGHYEFTVMPFGLSNAPATFQSLMKSIFHSYLQNFVLVFFDDIMVYKPFHSYSLFLFGDNFRDFAIIDWPRPASLKGLRGFLGLTGYYWKFVKHYGLLAKPLTNMLKQGSFSWSPDSIKAFEALKHVLSTTPVLAVPDFSKQFVIEIDALSSGIRAVLSQDGHPITYLSKTLTLGLSTYDKEMLAIVFAMQHWCPYLLGLSNCKFRYAYLVCIFLTLKEWEWPKSARRPDIFPQFSPMKTPLPPPLPADKKTKKRKKRKRRKKGMKIQTKKPQKTQGSSRYASNQSLWSIFHLYVLLPCAFQSFAK
ncbi:ATP-dependent RNA helicase ddx18 [Pyrus ussuriensis x Pyrus communis]|uniref:ATP-dependent RNA helicase ddx18 n=1 Tax=Pyrus ussuriensis x Pyrus communis TaxID=2448454 RepID=A0A5N5GBL4_9ROSA|nr:ATP-dependent RNA helicase ddx18 [Pyrus ussuriensis x Pyrus communis]